MKSGQVLLIILGLSILLLASQGQLNVYLHPKLQMPLCISACVLLFLALRTKANDICSHTSFVVSLALVLSSLFYFEISSRFRSISTVVVERIFPSSQSKELPISSSCINNSSAHLNSSSSSLHIQKKEIENKVEPAKHLQDSITIPKEPPSVETVLHTNIPWLASAARENQWNFSKQVWLKGFVLTNPALESNGEIAIARAIVSCCAADAIAIAIRVPVDTVPQFAQYSWIEVRGYIRKELEKLPKRPRWDRYPNVVFANEYILEPDSIIAIENNVADPYIFYSTDDNEFKLSY